MIEPNRWDLGKAEVLGCEDSSMSRDHVQIGTDQNRDVEAEGLDAPGDLPDLLLAVDAAVARVWFELVDRNISDGELSASSWWERRRITRPRGENRQTHGRAGHFETAPV